MCLTLCLPLVAQAHIGVGAGDVDILVPSGGAPEWLLEAPWGLVIQEGGEARWLCHELLSAGGANELPGFAVGSDGRLLGAARLLTGVLVADESLYYSVDGCDWAPVQGATGRLVEDVAFHRSDPLVALAVTANLPAGDEPYNNGVLRSVDGGTSWAEVASWPGVVLRSVRFGPGEVAYALAARQDPEGAVLLRSEDGGLNWEEHLLPPDGVESTLFGRVAAVDPVDPDEVWLAFDGTLADGLLRTLDGGESFTPVTGLPSLVLDLTLSSDGAAWFVGGPRELWFSPDRTRFERREEAPQVWGGAMTGSSLTLAVNTLAHDEAVTRTLDGASFETQLVTLGLAGPLSCPAGSDVAEVCAPLYDDLVRTLTLMRPRPSGGDDDDSAVDPSTCEGCALEPSRAGPLRAAGALGLLGALAFARRRRWSAPTA